MQERREIKFKGKPLTLTGSELQVGRQFADVTLTANDLSDLRLSSFAGKTIIISSVPSLDTRVCDKQTRRFSEEAGKLGDDIAVLTISMDLPFAQKRWMDAAEISNITTLSDYKDASFGKAYGLLIEKLHLLARAVVIIDKSGIIRYIQIVPEVGEEPDYDKVLTALKEIQQV